MVKHHKTYIGIMVLYHKQKVINITKTKISIEMEDKILEVIDKAAEKDARTRSSFMKIAAIERAKAFGEVLENAN